MDRKLTFYLYYHEEENIFTDDDGNIVYDIFEIITPQDLFLFRHNKEFNVFPMRHEPDVLCEIITITDVLKQDNALSYLVLLRIRYLFKKTSELYETTKYFGESMDVGDDYERIERFEKAKCAGDFI